MTTDRRLRLKDAAIHAGVSVALLRKEINGLRLAARHITPGARSPLVIDETELERWMKDRSHDAR